MRCQHPDILITEFAETALEFRFTNGTLVGDNATECGPTGVMHVHCYVCGLDKTYTSSKRLPNWARGLWKKLKGLG